MQITLFTAILIGAWYWIASQAWFLGNTWGQALFSGMMTGLILGDITTGCKVGAIIAPMFIAFTGAGGTIVWDQTAGTISGTAVVIAGGIPINQALTVALPVSLLFAQIHTIRRIWLAYPAMLADKAALTGNDRAIRFYGSGFCQLSKVVLYFIPMTLAILFGANSIGTLMKNLPVWMVNMLSAVGGLLPALGFAMTLRVIGRPAFLPFFLGGFFLVQYTKIGGLFLAFIGLFFAFIYYLILAANQEEDTSGKVNLEGGASLNSETKRLLSVKDADRVFRRFNYYQEQSNSFARLQSISFCCAFIPVLKKLYGHNPEEYKAALQRHLMFFNTQGIWGAVIHGIVLAMEEQRAMGAPIEVDAITGIKAGLMGPFAGIGDTIDWGVTRPLLTILFIPMAAAGSPMASILHFIILYGILFTEGTIFCRTGYRLGTRAALNILQGHTLHTFISCASVLGLFMMGGLSASMVSVTTPIFIPTTGTPMMVQTGILDKVAPGLLTLTAVLGTYAFLLKGNSMTKATLVLLLIGFVLGSIGIIGKGGLVFSAYVAPKK